MYGKPVGGTTRQQSEDHESQWDSSSGEHECHPSSICRDIHHGQRRPSLTTQYFS